MKDTNNIKPDKNMLRRLMHLAIKVLVVVLWICALFYLTRGNGQSMADIPDNKLAPELVRVAPVEKAPLSREVRYFGVTRPVSRAALSFTVSGRMKSRPVDIGSQVKAGDVLASLDDESSRNSISGLRAQLAEIEARLKEANIDKHRNEKLFRDAVVSSKEKEGSDTKVGVLEAQRQSVLARLAEARRLKGETVLRAGFDGAVTAVHAEAGEYIDPGRPVVELASDRAEIEIEVSEALISSVTRGSAVQVSFPVAGGLTVDGHIRSVGRIASGKAGRLFPIIIDLPLNRDVVSGMTTEVLLTIPAQEGVTVPVEAVANPDGEQSVVFEIKENKVKRVPVKVLHLDGDRVFIKGNLTAGDDVAIGGHSFLLDGDYVEVAR